MAELIPVRSKAEIPPFKSEDEAAEFWSTHEITDELWDELEETGDG